MALITFWSLFLCTGCYFALAIWRLAIARHHPGAQYLAIAFAGMAFWTGAGVTGIPLLVVVGEVLRDLGWLSYLFWTARDYDQPEVTRAVRRYCLYFLGLVSARTILTLAAPTLAVDANIAKLLLQVLLGINWVYALSGIVFAHYLYRATAASAASGFRLIVVALGIIWAYNLNFFTLLLLGYGQAFVLSGGLGVLLLLLVPAFALAARRKERWKVNLSRDVATRSVFLLAIGTYFVIVSSATRLMIWVGGDSTRPFAIIAAILLAALVVAISLLPQLRARIKAAAVRNLFEHRYDYRTEWLRFTATIGGRAEASLSPEERAIRSITDVTESLGGALLLAERGNQLVLAGTWRWPAHGLFAHALPVSSAWLGDLASSGRILTLDEVRTQGASAPEDAGIPDWLLAERDAWVGVPLVRSDRLVGLVLLARPRFDRKLDWEDFDLLKVVAQQVAVHLADAQSQSELEEARRFEEFNRRFAFIIHDLKNVVSQLSLMSGNAVEHAANPKFQAAMAKTLENATGKMTSLLSRLSTEHVQIEPVLREVAPAALLQRLAREYESKRQIGLSIEQGCTIRADEAQLHEALGHLIMNAIEASSPDAPISLSLTIWHDVANIAVEDRGCGMSPEFIRKQLFKPFSSTKPRGFGIGAAEARALILAMGGDLDVVSVEGEGTRFVAKFPLTSSPSASET